MSTTPAPLHPALQLAVALVALVAATTATAASPPGLDSWSVRDGDYGPVYFAAAWGNGAFAVSGQGAALSSPDGVSWTPGTVPPTWDNYVDLSFDADGFLACGYLDGTVAVSADGATFSEVSRRLQNDHFNAIARQGSVVVTGGYDHVNYRGEIYRSTDGGETFDEIAPGFGTAEDVDVVDGTFYLVAWLYSGSYYTNTVYSSPTGTGWDDSFAYEGGQARALAVGNGTFVLVGSSGSVATSPNGSAWTGQWAGTTEHLMDVAFGNGVFVAVGANGTVISSADGASWTPHASGTTFLLRGVTFGADSFVAVGDNSPTSDQFIVIQSGQVPFFAGDFEAGTAAGWSYVVY